ncbi:MAG: hypothetical protein IPM35_36895 [Myxococcales bacterium]|nr:hypothetical protein [Myxococcales bacterium]
MRPARDLARTVDPKTLKAPTPKAVESLSRPSRETEVRARLDRFYNDMKATYRVDGEEVRVSPHFRSNFGQTEADIQARVRKIAKLVGKEKFPSIALAAAHATGTRGSAKNIAKTVQAMIDAGGLTPYRGLSKSDAIRQMMWDHEIGLDCRGFAGQALLYSRGSGDVPARADRFGLNPNFVIQESPGFRKVPLAQARAGDWIRLSPVAGRDHNVIVRSNSLRAFDAPTLVVAGKSVPRAFAEDGWPRGSTPSVRVLEVDGSWGGAGVERRVWIHNEKSGLWGHWNDRGELQFGRGPYAHDLDGVYRPRRDQ